MRKLRDYLSEIVVTEDRSAARKAARLALVDITDPQGLPELVNQLGKTSSELDRLNKLLMEAYNAGK